MWIYRSTPRDELLLLPPVASADTLWIYRSTPRDELLLLPPVASAAGSAAPPRPCCAPHA